MIVIHGSHFLALIPSLGLCQHKRVHALTVFLVACMWVSCCMIWSLQEGREKSPPDRLLFHLDTRCNSSMVSSRVPRGQSKDNGDKMEGTRGIRLRNSKMAATACWILFGYLVCERGERTWWTFGDVAYL